MSISCDISQVVFNRSGGRVVSASISDTIGREIDIWPSHTLDLKIGSVIAVLSGARQKRKTLRLVCPVPV